MVDNWQWELEGVTFGEDTDYLVTEFEFEKPEARGDNDFPNPRADGIRFGRDFLGGTLYEFDMEIAGGASDEIGLKLLSDLRRVWENESVRTTPGAVVPLRFKRTGEPAWRVYGRPRRFTPASMENVGVGYIPLTCDFQASDHLVYADAEENVVVDLVPPSAGGLEAPLEAPLSTVATSPGEPGAFVVGGDTDTWAVITFNGPCTNPVCEITDLFRVQLRTTLASDQTVTIDPRPWNRGVLRNDGAGQAGKLTANSPRLSKLKVPPGSHTVTFRAQDQTGTSSMRFAWRNARHPI